MFQQELIAQGSNQSIADRLLACQHIYSKTADKVREVKFGMTAVLDLADQEHYRTKIYHGWTHNRETAGMASIAFRSLIEATHLDRLISPSDYARLRLNLGIACIRHDLPFRSLYKTEDTTKPTIAHKNTKFSVLANPEERRVTLNGTEQFKYLLEGEEITSEEASSLGLISLFRNINPDRQRHKLENLFDQSYYEQVFNIIARGTYVIWDEDEKTVRPVYLERLINEFGIFTTSEVPNVFPDTKIFPDQPYLLPGLLMLSAHIGDLVHATSDPKYFKYTLMKLAWENLMNNMPNSCVLRTYQILQDEIRYELQNQILKYFPTHLERQKKFVIGRERLTNTLVNNLNNLGSNAIKYLTSLNQRASETVGEIEEIIAIIKNMSFEELIRYQASENILTRIKRP